VVRGTAHRRSEINNAIVKLSRSLVMWGVSVTFKATKLSRSLIMWGVSVTFKATKYQMGKFNAPLLCSVLF